MCIIAIRKAFDRVHHKKLQKALLDVIIHVIIVDVLFNWYITVYYSPLWNGSSVFSL